MDTRSTSRLPARASCGALLSLVAAALTAGGGCRSGENTTASATDTGPTAAAVTETTGPIDLETRYLIGPDAARTLDYRIDWQVHALAAGQRGLRSVTAQYDSLFVLDEQNYLTRFRREDGQRLWRIPVSNAWEEILGVNFMPDVDRIYLTTGGALLELDALTGSTVGQQPLEKVANTAPVRAGTFLIYGARNGQLVWHAFPVAFQWRAYQISRSIQMKPLLYEDVVFCVGNDGRIMGLDLDTAAQLWNKKLLDAVVAPPVAGNGAIYLAGTDQYLYCFDAFSGRTLWSRLNESPLTNSPTLVGNRIYQQIPGSGLTCFDAMPFDDPDGEILWTARSIAGNVLTSRRSALLAWDGAERQMAVVDQGRGAVVHVVDLPQVNGVVASSSQNGELFAIAEDGRIERLVPRN